MGRKAESAKVRDDKNWELHQAEGDDHHETTERIANAMSSAVNLKTLTEMLAKPKVSEAIITTVTAMKTQETRGAASADLAASLGKLSAEDLSNFLVWAHVPSLNSLGPGQTRSAKSIMPWAIVVSKAALLKALSITRAYAAILADADAQFAALPSQKSADRDNFRKNHGFRLE